MSREADIRALLTRALTSPLNVLPAAAMAGVGFAFGLWPLYIAAAAWYGIAAFQTIRDPREARRVIDRRRGAAGVLGGGPEPELRDPEIRRRYREAIQEGERLREAIAASPIPTPEVETDLVGIGDDLRTLCLQAERLSGYLGTVDLDDLRRRAAAARARLAGASSSVAPSLEHAAAAADEQVALAEGLTEQRDRFDAEIDALVSTLGSIRAEVVRVAVSAESDAAARVRAQVGGARKSLRAMSGELAERERALPGSDPPPS